MVSKENDRRAFEVLNSKVILNEWVPDDDSDSLSITAPENFLRPRVVAEHPKENLEF